MVLFRNKEIPQQKFIHHVNCANNKKCYNNKERHCKPITKAGKQEVQQ